jgi:hypothetical protein
MQTSRAAARIRPRKNRERIHARPQYRTSPSPVGFPWPVDDEDLDEISHRINALREALAGIEPGDLDAQEPVTMFDQRGGPDEP